MASLTTVHLLLGLHLLAQPGLAGLQETAYREGGQEEEARDKMASFYSEMEGEGMGRRDKRASFYRAGGDMAQQVGPQATTVWMVGGKPQLGKKLSPNISSKTMQSCPA